MYFILVCIVAVTVLQDDIRAMALRVLREMICTEPEPFHCYAELTILKLLEAHKDPVKEVCWLRQSYKHADISAYSELVTRWTRHMFTFLPESELVTVNSSQRLSYGTVNSPHCDHQTVNSSQGKVNSPHCDHQTVTSSQWTRHKDCHRVQWTRHTVITKQWTRHKDCHGTVNSPHCDHQTVNSSQWTRHGVKWTRHTVISSHRWRGDLVTQNSLLSSQGLSRHLPHRFTHPPHRLRRVCSFQSKFKTLVLNETLNRLPTNRYV